MYLLDDCFSPSLRQPVIPGFFSPLVPSHCTASLQVLRDLRLPHILLHLHRADPGLTQVSTYGSTLSFSQGVYFCWTRLY